jgi:hypothetical protein
VAAYLICGRQFQVELLAPPLNNGEDIKELLETKW